MREVAEAFRPTVGIFILIGSLVVVGVLIALANQAKRDPEVTAEEDAGSLTADSADNTDGTKPAAEAAVSVGRVEFSVRLAQSARRKV